MKLSAFHLCQDVILHQDDETTTIVRSKRCRFYAYRLPHLCYVTLYGSWDVEPNDIPGTYPIRLRLVGEDGVVWRDSQQVTFSEGDWETEFHRSVILTLPALGSYRFDLFLQGVYEASKVLKVARAGSDAGGSP